MPHAPGHGRYGFGTGMPEDIYGVFSNVAPFVPPEYNEEQFRMAMGFVPVAGTIYNWNQMGPWRRTGSVAMDALDLLTAGSGKALTTPLKAFSKWLQPEDMMRYLRFGQVPLSPEGRPVASRSNIAFGVGSEMREEAGVSVYQSLLDPKTGKYVLRDAPPPYTMPPSHPMNPAYPTGSYTHSPIGAQNQFINRMALEWQNLNPVNPRKTYYQPHLVTGSPMSVLGTDKEVLLSVPSIRRTRRITPLDVVTQGNPSMALPSHHLETMGAHPGMTRTVLSDIPNVSFEKYDQFGRPILNSWQKLIQQASRANIPSTIPATMLARGFDWNEGDFNFTLPWDTPGLFGGVAPQRPYQTPFNLEENYQQQAANRGGWSPGG